MRPKKDPLAAPKRSPDTEKDYPILSEPDIAMSDSGFLGANEELMAVINKDAQTVRSLLLSHKEIADELQYFVELVKYILLQTGAQQTDIEQTGFGTSTTTLIEYKGRSFLVSGKRWLGGQDSPFMDGTRGIMDIFVVDLETGERLFIPELVVVMGGNYGFYEGNVPYRIDPAQVARMRFPDLKQRIMNRFISKFISQ